MNIDYQRREPFPFPKLMEHINKHYVVLFTNQHTGIVISNGTPGNMLGKYSQNWNPQQFQDFTSKIILSNY